MFVEKDLERIEPNDFADLNLFKDMIFNANTDKFTLVDGDVMAIVLACNYVGRNYIGGFVISKHIKIKHIKELKESLWKYIENEGIERIETKSLDCDIINKWHEFLGLKEEGLHKKYAFGKDYKTWAWVKDEKN